MAPLSIDMLALLCSLAIHVPSLHRRTKVTSVVVLLVAGSASVLANWFSGATVGAKAVHGSMLLWHLLAETVASQVTDAVAKAKGVKTLAGDGEEKAAMQVAGTEVTASDAAAPDLPVAPTSPAPRVFSGGMSAGFVPDLEQRPSGFPLAR